MTSQLLATVSAITTSIQSASNKTDLFHALNASSRALGFDLFTLSCHRADGRAMILDATFTTVDKGFLSDYDHFDWFEDDPMAARIVDGVAPFSWNSVHDRHAEIRKQSYLDFLQAGQLATGIMVPLAHRPGTVSMLGMISLSDRQYDSEDIIAAMVVGNAAMAQAEMLGLCPEVSTDEAFGIRQLSPVQTEILKWVAEGKSNIDIATILNMNSRTVRYHIDEVLRKLGVATRLQAVAMIAAVK